MKYIIMCGGVYKIWSKPRQLTLFREEPIVARTIRLLRENGVSDISISSNLDGFGGFGVPVLTHLANNLVVRSPNDSSGQWYTAFYPTEEPVCYIFGDVVFSPQAIETIVKTDTDDIQFFASSPPFSKQYSKPWAEPFALKVKNLEHFRDALETVRKYDNAKMFNRKPIMWEVWQVIKGTPINKIDYTNYVAINDYTCDIDRPEDIEKIEALMEEDEKTKYMIHAVPSRRWYVDDYLIPSMLEQGIEESQITVYEDTKKEGNLLACMHSFQQCVGKGGTWHIQDDVIISRDFKEKTERFDNGIVCGFKSYYDNDTEAGVVPVKKMWWSFPCIRIPNEIARKCAEHTIKYMIGNPVYKKWWCNGRSDDTFFRHYVWDNYKGDKAYNLAPNIVDHVDYLLGGSVTSKNRKNPIVRSDYWEDEDLVEALAKRLKEDSRCGEYYGKK